MSPEDYTSIRGVELYYQFFVFRGTPPLIISGTAGLLDGAANGLNLDSKGTGFWAITTGYEWNSTAPLVSGG